MTIFICTGSPAAKPDRIFDHLTHLGVAHASTARGEEALSIEQWHQNALTRADSQHGQLVLSRSWEHAAAEIFRANWQHPRWGWGHVNATRFLEFWHGFDAETFFVLLTLPPEEALAQALLTPEPVEGGSAVDVEAVLDDWLQGERDRLHFYLRNRARCVLINAASVPAWPERLADELGHLLGDVSTMKLSTPSDSTADASEHFSLVVQALAQQVLPHFPKTIALWNEIIASALPDEDSAGQNKEAATGMPRVVSAAWRALGKAWQEQHILGRNLAVSHSKQQTLNQRLEDAQQSANEWQARANSHQTHIDRLDEEKKVLATQLSHVQDDLESLFRKQRKTEDSWRAECDKSRALSEDRDKLSKALQNERKQLQAAQQTIEQFKQRDHSQHSDLKKQLDEIQKSNRVLKDEKAFLQTQLHQVQEELERLWREHRSGIAKQNESEKRRWQRLYQRYPDYTEWSRIEVKAVSEADPVPFIQWRVLGLNVGGRRIPDFDCFIRIMEGNPALVFPRGPSDQPAVPLMRWPIPALNKAELVLQPAGETATQLERLGNLAGLSSSDWRLIQHLTSDFIGILLRPMPAGGEGRWPRAAFWLERVRSLHTQFAEVPDFWRYDGLRLTREAGDSSQEQLWVEMDRASFGDRIWPKYQLRIGAVQTSPEIFSRLPTLDFPEPLSGQPPALEGWFPQMQDASGSFMRISVDLEAGSELGDMLSRLSESDHKVLAGLMVALPNALIWLQKSGVKIRRPWQQWLQLVADFVTFYLREGQPVVNRKVSSDGPASLSSSPDESGLPDEPDGADIPAFAAPAEADARLKRIAPLAPSEGSGRIKSPRQRPASNARKKTATKKSSAAQRTSRRSKQATTE